MKVLCVLTVHACSISGQFIFVLVPCSGNHWDDVILQYKELELGPNNKVPDQVKAIMTKVQRRIEESIGHSATFLSPHVIDLSADGYIGT